jgi:hypothetical protein
MDADDFFRQDAQRLGLSIEEYERKFSIQLAKGPAEGRIRYAEVSAGVMTEDELRLVHRRERRTNENRNHKRMRPRAIRRRAA